MFFYRQFLREFFIIIIAFALQRERSKKRSEHFESNGTNGTSRPCYKLILVLDQSHTSLIYFVYFFSFPDVSIKGLYVQHNAKRPKMMKQSPDDTYDNIMSVSGSIPCPMASQISSMSNQNKLMRYIGGRDRSRKAKELKVNFVAAWLEI